MFVRPPRMVSRRHGRTVPPMAAVFNLNHPAHLVHWHFFQMTVSNVVVIVVMVAVFALAILAPFPHQRAGGDSS